MREVDLHMAKSSIEKALEKQQKEAKRLADKQIRENKRQMEKDAIIQRAISVVNGQTFVGGMRIMDRNAEEILSIILSEYDGNENRFVQGHLDRIPEAYHYSISFEFEKLKMYGMISNSNMYLDATWNLNLTAQGITYFDDKENAISKDVEQLNRNKTLVSKEYDVFLSHANADKLSYVDSLYNSLKKLGVSIFYDKEELSWGDNWKQRILDGTAKSEFAIIVISENFFDREWTEKELNEFLQRQNESGQKIILPLLHKVDFNDLKNKYPDLESIQSLKTSDRTVEEITILFAKELIKRYKGVC